MAKQVLTVMVVIGAALIASGQSPREAVGHDPDLGIISGRATDRATGGAVANATIIAVSFPLSKAPVPVATDFTNSNGEFSLKLKWGTYVLFANRSGYMDQFYGAPRPGRVLTDTTNPGTLVEAVSIVAPNNLKDLTFDLTPLSTISGILTDLRGVPLPKVEVQLLSAGYDEFGRKSYPIVPIPESLGARAVSDDRGVYRLINIPPGRYYVSAGPVTLLLAAIDHIDAPSEIDSPYIRRYYPGTDTIADAQVLVVAPGSHLEAINMSIAKKPTDSMTYRISGRLLDIRTGQAPPKSSLQGIRLLPIFAEVLNNAPFANVALGTEGSFEILNVQSGKYWLTAEVRAYPLNRNGQLLSGDTAIRGALVAIARVDVNNRDVDGLSLTLKPTAHVEGVVSVQEGLPLSDSEYDWLKIQLDPVLVGNTSVITMAPPSAAAVTGKGFTFENISTGPYSVRIFNIPAGYYLKSIRVDEQDATGVPIYFSDAPDHAMSVVLSRKAGSLKGRVTDSELRLVRNARVVLVPTLETGRLDFYKTALTNSKGEFTIGGIAPGQYEAYAFAEMEQNRHFDSQFMVEFKDRALTIVVEEMSSQEIELKQIIPTNL